MNLSLFHAGVLAMEIHGQLIPWICQARFTSDLDSSYWQLRTVLVSARSGTSQHNSRFTAEARPPRSVLGPDSACKRVRSLPERDCSSHPGVGIGLLETGLLPAAEHFFPCASLDCSVVVLQPLRSVEQQKMPTGTLHQKIADAQMVCSTWHWDCSPAEEWQHRCCCRCACNL